jgi:hypothetical protein
MKTQDLAFPEAKNELVFEYKRTQIKAKKAANREGFRPSTADPSQAEEQVSDVRFRAFRNLTHGFLSSVLRHRLPAAYCLLSAEME